MTRIKALLSSLIDFLCQYDLLIGVFISILFLFIIGVYTLILGYILPAVLLIVAGIGLLALSLALLRQK